MFQSTTHIGSVKMTGPSPFSVLFCYLCKQLFPYQSKIVNQHSQDQDGLKGQYDSQQYFKQNAFNYTFDHWGVRGLYFFF